MNPYIYNPAYAGVDGHTVISAMYRQQWVGLDGAPAISHITFHTPLEGGIGIGAFAYNERQNALDNSGVKFSGSYLANFDRKHWLRFGLSLGAATNSVNTDLLDNPFDPAFANIANNSFHMIGDFGVTYHSGHFNFGISMPSLFSSDIITQDSFEQIRVKPQENLFFKANYSVGFLDDDFVFEPHFLYRYSANSADQYEASAIIHVAHHIWFGGSYRQDAGIVALFGIKVKEKLAIGYAFDLGDSKVRSFTGNTHELHIGFHLGSKKEHAEHVSSFIKRHRKTAEERKAEAEERRLAQLEGETEPEDNALLQSTPSTDTPEVDPDVDAGGADGLTPGQAAAAGAAGAAGVAAVAGAGQDDPGVAQGAQTGQPGATPQTGQTVTTVPGTENPIDQTLTDDNRTPAQLAASNEPLRVRRGNHMLELPVGNYVVNGAFRSFDNAENFSDQLFERGFHDVKVGYVTATGYYYVVVNQVNEIDRAQSEARRLRGRNGFEETWVLSVE